MVTVGTLTFKFKYSRNPTGLVFSNARRVLNATRLLTGLKIGFNGNPNPNRQRANPASTFAAPSCEQQLTRHQSSPILIAWFRRLRHDGCLGTRTNSTLYPFVCMCVSARPSFDKILLNQLP
eukprot:1195406-Prorocentrum_minimum.AAC.5